MTELVALIGYPLRHSVSPSFQQAAFDHYGLDIRYEKWEVEAAHLEETVARLRQPHVLGANVTIPYKEAVVPLLDELDGLAARIGAVNTVVNEQGRLTGYNTDASGFINALRRDAGFEPGNKRAVVLGAGGAGRAVCVALAREGVAYLAIANRTQEKAERLAGDMRRDAGEVVVSILPWETLESSETVSSCDLLVNCTPVGMRYSSLEMSTPLRAVSIPGHALVCDLVYNPIETLLLREATKAGARVLGGLSMLVYQGAASFERWVGREAPLELMLRRAREALG
ncbi:MAG: shikimate dehydrogenase [Chloroflexi bacterium]|nr:MAG: shikimate dehydrogenase [Chloroflexota bacterium]RLC96658.1 MAG: shikimate dehydrogenase [Chloroflexota bacterium]